MKKKKIKIWFIILLLIFVFTLITFLILKLNNGEIPLINKDVNNLKIFNNNSNTNNSSDEVDTSTTSTGGGGSNEANDGVSGGGSTTISSDEETLNCYTRKISYSMINPQKVIVCNKEESGICIDKTIECSTTIQNLDNEISGDFEIKISFVEDGKTIEEAFDSSNSKITISTNSEDTIKASTKIQSSEEDGLANKLINCFYNTIKVPIKEVC